MDSELNFGKLKIQQKVMRLKYKKDISLQEAWDIVRGTQKSKKSPKSPSRKYSLQKKVMDLKYRKDIPLQEAWDIVLKKTRSKSVKLTKKQLDSMSLLKLRKIAYEYNISSSMKSSDKLVKKSTLLRRLKDSRHIKKILS